MNRTRCNKTANVAIEASQMTELVRGSEQLLLELVAPLVRRQSVALDLGSVQRIDAAGIAALISLYDSARKAGHIFTVTNVSPRVVQILSLVGLDRILLSQNTVQASHCGSQILLTAA